MAARYHASMRILVIGGTLFIGREIAFEDRLLAARA